MPELSMKLNPCVAEITTIHNNQINTMAADGLARYATRSSADMVLTMQFNS